MKYTSTRDSSISVTFEEALCSGYAPDGGLYVPERLPDQKELSAETLQFWATLSYADLMYQVLRLFIGRDEIDDASLHDICHSALEGCDDPAVQVVPVGELYVAELFHGPTFCFKDLGMRGVINLLSFFATKRQRRISLLVATTGDTGPAAVQAVSDVNNPLLTLVVHYPENQISNFQRKQLTTVSSPCVKVVAFEGGGDDMDLPIKRILSGTPPNDESLSSSASSSSFSNKDTLYTGVNSYNIGRPIMQMVHYVWTYLRVMEQQRQQQQQQQQQTSDEAGKPITTIGDPNTVVDIVLPTGAMGNIAGGYMMACMGLPIGTFVAGVNVNDITHRLVQTGAFHRSATMHKTLSDAINIQVPYNAERLFYYLTDCNAELIKEWYEDMETTGKFDLPAEWHAKLRERFASARVTDERMCASLKRVYETFQYLADPHTAVALDAAHQLGYDSRRSKNSSANDAKDPLPPPVAVLSTASPCKFEESVTAAVGASVWQEYLNSDAFPSSAKAVLERPEITPIRYMALDSLEESQKSWEIQARSILADFEKLSN